MSTAMIIFVFLIGGAADGGAATQVHEIRFKDATACDAAAKKIKTDSQLWVGMIKGGIYRVEAICVAGLNS